MTLRVFAIILVFLFYITSVVKVSAGDENQQSGNREEVIKVDAALVNVPVIVKSKDENIPLALRADNFELYEDGVKQEIGLFAAEDSPANITLLINASGNQISLWFAQHSASDFIKMLGASDRVKIASFAEKIDTLTDFTSDKETLARAVASIKHAGRSRLGDALYDTALEMKKIKGRKVILVFTDGYSNSSHPQKEILNELAESGAVTYVVSYPCQVIRKEFQGPNSDNPPPSNERFNEKLFPLSNRSLRIEKLHFINSPEAGEKTYNADLDFLVDVVESTGGQFFKTGVTGSVSDFMKKVLKEMRCIYTLGYYPTNPVQNGGFRKIKLVLRNQIKASLRYKKGYDASGYRKPVTSGN